MAILWAGGEDIDFTAAVTVNTSAGHFRSGYARCVVLSSGSYGALVHSQPFSGGALTSAWLSCRVYIAAASASRPIIGFGLSGTQKALTIGTASASSSRVAIHKHDGTTLTQLAAESGNSLATGALHQLDMQVISYGASATVNVYYDSALVVTYTGDVSVSGMSNFDCVVLGNTAANSPELSEIIVADEDTRTFSLVTLAPSAAGTTDQWTGAYTDVDETTNSDADLVYTNTATQDEQFNLTNLPSGLFSIKAVRVAARASSSAGATATKVGLGINSGGTVDSGTLQATTTTWATVERLMTTNPVTGVKFTQSEIDALQINLRSGS